jgi:hypothetical protein
VEKMSTHNWADGNPAPGEWWACTAQSPAGQIGVLVGRGKEIIGLIDERVLSEMIERLKSDGEDNLVRMVEAAAASLPGFKASVQKRDKAGLN